MEKTKTVNERAYRRFLKHGKIHEIDEHTLAATIDRRSLQLVQKSLPEALRESRRLVDRTVNRNGALRLSAVRALGRAALMSGEYSEAEKAYREARGLLADDALGRGRIDRTLVDVYMYLGRFDESKRRAKMALRTFERLQNRVEIAKAQVNYGNLLHRQDRHREAEKLYKKAADYFVSAGDDLSAARCHFNRANTLVQLFEFDEAERLYALAGDAYSRHGHALDAVDARWGISWLHMLEGKFHVALRELQDCEESFREIGVPLRVASCELDRAEVYLNLNLFYDAREAARSAEKQFKRLDIRYEQAKAAFYRATAAFSLGARREGREALQRARKGFLKDKNTGFLGAVELLAARAATRSENRNQCLKKAYRYFEKAQLPLWQAMCDLHSLERDHNTQTALDRLSRNPAAHVVPHIYAGWQTLLGDKHARNKRMSLAREHWQQAAQRLDKVRATLPPIELRSTFGRQAVSPHARLIQTELERDPLEAAVWSERLKTAGIWSPVATGFDAQPARQKVEESLVKLSQQVALLSQQIFDGKERSVGGAEENRTVRQLQRRVREQLLELEKSDEAGANLSAYIANLCARESRQIPIVQFHISDDRFIAFVHEGGETRCHVYACQTERFMRMMARWRFQLETVALADHLSGGSLIAEEKKLFDELGELLWQPLELSHRHEKILIVPEGELSNLPWYAVRVGGEPLVERHAFTLCPSIRHYANARQIRVRSTATEIMVGPAEDLPHVESELEPLLAMGDGNVRRHDPCSRSDWPTQGSARHWHFAGHAHLNRQNPFYSSLSLHDGPLFAADFRIRNARVHLVTLAACQSGTHVSLPGEESSGLVRSLLEMGARNVIAGHWPVADNATSEWMRTFYGLLGEGQPLHAAGRQAAQQVREAYPSAYHWAAFSIFGAGS